MRQSTPASANPNGGDDEGFVDIDELLSGMQQKSVSAMADSNSGGMLEIVDGGTRSGSPTDSAGPTVGRSQGEHPVFLTLVGALYSYHRRSDHVN